MRYTIKKAAPPLLAACVGNPQMLPSPTALPAAAKINPSRELNCPRFDAIVFSPNRHRSLAEVGLRKSAIKRFRLAKTAGAYAMIRAFIARVVKLVDTRDLKSLAGNSVPVQVRPRAPSRSTSVLIDLPSAFCGSTQLTGDCIHRHSIDNTVPPAVVL